jgi:hypothetical protein
MSYWKSFGLAIFATICLLGETTGSAHAKCDVGPSCATEWSGGKVIDLGGLPGSMGSAASGINAAGQVVGASNVGPPIPPAPESSTWAMMLIGFAGLALAGYRSTRRRRVASLRA